MRMSRMHLRMMENDAMKRWIVYIILPLLLLTVFSGCGNARVPDEEIASVAQALIADSVEINVIYFGAGLSSVPKDSAAALGFTNYSYLPVDPATGYKSIDDIKAATKKVYSASYCEYLFTLAFSGITEDNGTTAAYARYMEHYDGTLAVRREIEGYPIRTYEGPITVVENRGTTATVRLQSYVDGKADVEVDVQLVLEKDGWRLDSPTY